MTICGVDNICLLSALLLLTSNSLKIVEIAKFVLQHPVTDFARFKALNPDYLQEEFKYRSENRSIYLAEGTVTALCWLVFCVPMLQVAWILSRGGSRKVGLHTFIVLCVLSGSYVEFMAKLMKVGEEQIVYFLWKQFNLNNWIDSSSNKGIGYRAIAVITTLINGIYYWMDSFEWLVLFFTMYAIYRSVNRFALPDHCPFSYRWATLGMTIGTMSFFDLVANLLRIHDFLTYQQVALVFSTINTVVLLPVWMIWLGLQLPHITAPPIVKREEGGHSSGFVAGVQQQVQL